MSRLSGFAGGRIGHPYGCGAGALRALAPEWSAVAPTAVLVAAAAHSPATPNSRRTCLQHARGHALDLGDRGHAGSHLLEAVVAQVEHALALGDGDDRVDGG